MRIGLIADTHLPVRGIDPWREVAETFGKLDLILHAGDIVAEGVLDQLQDIAPVLAAKGNNDLFTDHRMKPLQILENHGQRLIMIHDIEPEDSDHSWFRDFYFGGQHADIIVSGHTHVERIDFRDNILQVNPGSPTLPRLWTYRHGTVGVMDWEPGNITVEIRRIGETDGLRNPGVEYRYTTAEGVIHPGA